MSNVATEGIDTIGQLLEQLGDIPASRVLFKPTPGEATEADLLRSIERNGRLCELVDGTLVEKSMGFEESSLAIWLCHLLRTCLGDRNLGKWSGESGMMRLMPGLVRAPDLSFTRWSKFPDGRRSAGRIADLIPDLAIEILSISNTPGEIRRKLREYFLAGTELVWIVDPDKRVVVVHTTPEVCTTLTEDDALDGAGVLPGITLPVRRVFEETEVVKKSPRRKRRNP